MDLTFTNEASLKT